MLWFSKLFLRTVPFVLRYTRLIKVLPLSIRGDALMTMYVIAKMIFTCHVLLVFLCPRLLVTAFCFNPPCGARHGAQCTRKLGSMRFGGEERYCSVRGCSFVSVAGKDQFMAHVKDEFKLYVLRHWESFYCPKCSSRENSWKTPKIPSNETKMATRGFTRTNILMLAWRPVLADMLFHILPARVIH
jgi:hypothetical protein